VTDPETGPESGPEEGLKQGSKEGSEEGPEQGSEQGPEIGSETGLERASEGGSEKGDSEKGGSEKGGSAGQPGRPRDAAHLVAMAFATGGGAGYIPLAPGTFGSLVGVALFLAFSNLGFAVYIASVVALTAIGVWASERAECHFACADDGRIVIDEVAGQLLTLAPLVVLKDLPLGSVAAPYGDPLAWRPGGALDFLASSPFAALDIFFLLVVTGFVLFRLLDIWKPGAIGWAERKFSGGVGVMVDDMMAGLFGAILLTLPAYAALAGLLKRVAL
jgi:phosphatidylglycerophosphatase A